MKLKREFYSRSTLDVARDLLGKNLVHYTDGERLVGKIVEAEAYIGPVDKAAHSYRGKTERNEVMFGPPGHAYVYKIYGVYNCMNTITQKEGEGTGVLIRAVEPVENIEIMAHNRYGMSVGELGKKQILNLTSGPAKLCIAMGITNKNNNGMDLYGDTLWIEEGAENETFEIVETTRVNIDYAEEAVHFPWRFYIKDNPFVSVK
ncbi:MAG: DNA-3-methyladenine glycosylase [Natronincolaceae bacterium]|jgi:DNA-3-methyladenine glycosylase|nr:DNA-3-methyladenine glycosylase [Bacillota bacterium]NLK90462.1 DNA-3-methyladenine glycosylase [Clostridiales bacterium]